jgi:hypothetical protein
MPSLPPLTIGGRDLAEKLDLVQTFSGPFRNSAQGIFRDMHGQASLFAQETIEPA